MKVIHNATIHFAYLSKPFPRYWTRRKQTRIGRTHNRAYQDFPREIAKIIL